MHKVILAVAPVAAEDGGAALEPLVEDIVACWEAGATFLHLHPLDRKGRFEPSARYFDRIVRAVRARTDLIIEGSTGSAEVPVDDRFRVMCHPETEAFTFTAGDVELPGKGRISTSWEEMQLQRDLGNQYGLRADFQIFSREHLENIRRLQAQAPFLREPIYTLVYTWGTERHLPPERLLEDIRQLPEGAVFGLLDGRACDRRLLMTSVAMGARFVRVGFEDGRCLDGERTARTNAELVRLAAFLIRQAGARVATAEEARQILKIPPRDDGNSGERRYNQHQL